MMMKWLGLAVGLLIPMETALAQSDRLAIENDKYHITDEERTACQNDAVLFCSTAYPDEDALLACMKLVRPKLSQGCRTVFEAGLKRRRIPF